MRPNRCIVDVYAADLIQRGGQFSWSVIHLFPPAHLVGAGRPSKRQLFRAAGAGVAVDDEVQVLAVPNAFAGYYASCNLEDHGNTSSVRLAVKGPRR